MYPHVHAWHRITEGLPVSRPELLKTALERQIRRMGVTRRLEGGTAMARWADVVGPQIAARSEPVSFNRGTLTVAVPEAAWRQELTLEKERLTARLNQALGKNVVRDIYFVAAARNQR